MPAYRAFPGKKPLNACSSSSLPVVTKQWWEFFQFATHTSTLWPLPRSVCVSQSSVKKWRILSHQSFSAHMPLLTPSSIQAVFQVSFQKFCLISVATTSITADASEVANLCCWKYGNHACQISCWEIAGFCHVHCSSPLNQLVALIQQCEHCRTTVRVLIMLLLLLVKFNCNWD